MIISFIFGMLVGAIFFALAVVIYNVRDIEKSIEENKHEERRWSSDPYRFSVTREVEGWRWEILYRYVSRSLTESYEPLNYRGGEAIFGYESTQEAAISAGRQKCEQMTQVDKWKEDRVVYSL